MGEIVGDSEDYFRYFHHNVSQLTTNNTNKTNKTTLERNMPSVYLHPVYYVMPRSYSDRHSTSS
jgi:hypothetical protein